MPSVPLSRSVWILLLFKFFDMKKLEINQIENVNGGGSCGAILLYLYNHNPAQFNFVYSMIQNGYSFSC